MAYSGNGGTKILLCLGLIVLVSSFCRCSPLTRLKALDKLRDNSTLGQGQATGNDLRHGRLLIGQKSLYGAKLKGTKATKSLLEIDTDYQADMGWVEPKHLKGQGEGFSMLRPDAAAVERLLKMEPKVECTVDSMKLQVQDVASTQGSLLFVDRGSRLSPLPLSKLPPNCGYTVRSTQKDLVLVAPYDGCFVAHEEDCYVLPLRWCGVPVKMSCPLMRPSTSNPPMVTCHTEGMVVKTEWTVSVTKIKINLNGNWEPLMTASPRCGFSVVVHPEGVVISVHYAPCLEKKDPSFSSVHLKPEFPESLKDMWKPLMPLGSNQRIPAHVPGEAFQQRSAAADYQTNGLNQAIQREAGNQKQKQVALNVNKQFKQYLSLCFFPQQ
uniref:Uncharacterized protein n=1 Tax=Seriola dumerili TaxID=41447 RepID=A0A3B4U4P5_SERDU